MKQMSARVTAGSELMPDVCLLWLHAPQIVAVARPGQFLMVRCGDGEDPLLRRPLSIHRTSDDGQVALLFRVGGRGTTMLSTSQVGDTVDVFGPLGNGFRLDPNAGRLLLIAGGIGVAPLVFLAERVVAEGREVHLVMGAQSGPHLYPRSLLSPVVTVEEATEDGSLGRMGLATDVAEARMDWADQAFACGPTSMYRAMATMPAFRGRRVQVPVEQMMGCGVGACYGCTVITRQGPRQVCQDGPVFELDEVLWDRFVSMDRG